MFLTDNCDLGFGLLWIWFVVVFVLMWLSCWIWIVYFCHFLVCIEICDQAQVQAHLLSKKIRMVILICSWKMYRHSLEFRNLSWFGQAILACYRPSKLMRSLYPEIRLFSCKCWGREFWAGTSKQLVSVILWNLLKIELRTSH